MADLLVNIVIASVVLTALINVIPRLFPDSSAEDRIRDLIGEQRVDQTHLSPDPGGSNRLGSAEGAAPRRPRFRIWFPWKSMLVGSLLVTALVNIVAFFS